MNQALKISLLLLTISLSFQNSNAQYEYQSRVLEDFNISRLKGDYNGIIKNGEEYKSIHIFLNNDIDSLCLLQINSFLSISYNELRYYDRIRALQSEVENYKFVYKDPSAIKSYFSTLCSINSALISIHDITQAEIVFNKCLNIYDSKTFEPWRYINLINNKIAILYEKGEQLQAEKLSKQTIKKLNNINSTLGMYSDLISHYFDHDKLNDAELTIQEALKAFDVSDSLNTGYRMILMHLSTLYREKSDYKNMLLTKERLLNLSRISSMSPRYLANDMASLAQDYSDLNKVEKALELCKEAIKIIENNFGTNSPELISILDLYGMILEGHSNTRNEAIKIYKRGLFISESQSDYYNDMEKACANISRLFSRPDFIYKNADSSLYYAKKQYHIVRKYFQESAQGYIDAVSNLALSYSKTEQSDSSIFYHLLAKNLYEKNNLNTTNYYNSELLYLAFEYDKLQSKEAIFFFNEWINYWRLYLKNNFYSIINDIDKADKLTSKFELYDYYAQRINDQRMFKISFENKIILKNIQLNYISILKRHSSKSEIANTTYNKLISLEISERNAKEIYELKTKISALIPMYKFIEKSLSISLDDCQNKLKVGDAMIEFGKYKYIYSDDGQQSDFYFALILEKGNNDISYVPLGFEEDINKILKANDEDINSLYQYSFHGLYDFIIQPIVLKLKGISNVYISSTGILSKFNFSAFQSKSGKNLSEMYRFYYISSTSEFVSTGNNNEYNISKIDKVYAYGGIDYGLSKSNITSSQYFSRTGVSKWNYLPGTLSEVNFIDSIFSTNKPRSIKLIGKDATEASIHNLESSASTYIMHIASHGFFLENSKKELQLDPLYSTGILFSGANNYWNQNKVSVKNSNDGILLGSEICDINLSNCSLAILSACQSGVGRILNNEGVFGLQRALKLAGVKNCIVSLWKVPDMQTSELFKQFYINFQKGDNIHDSFYNAQKAMKERYSLPKYWAGFVLFE